MGNDATKIIGSPAEATSAEAVEKQCPHCSAELPDEVQFCPHCGYQRGSWAGSAEPASGTAKGAIYELRSAAGESWRLFAGENEIGRGEVAVKVGNPYASRRHARIMVTPDGGATIEDLGSSNGTLINGQLIPAGVPQPLAPGGEFAIGQEVFSLYAVTIAEPTEMAASTAAEPTSDELPPVESAEGDVAPPTEPVEEEAPPAEPGADVVMSSWSIELESGEVHELPLGETIIGRKASACGIVVSTDGYVSGTHCKLQAEFGRLAIEDLGSTNGTFVHEEPLTPGEVTELEPGSKVRIGQTTFFVRLNSPAEPESDEVPLG